MPADLLLYRVQHLFAHGSHFWRHLPFLLLLTVTTSQMVSGQNGKKLTNKLFFMNHETGNFDIVIRILLKFNESCDIEDTRSSNWFVSECVNVVRMCDGLCHPHPAPHKHLGRKLFMRSRRHRKLHLGGMSVLPSALPPLDSTMHLPRALFGAVTGEELAGQTLHQLLRFPAVH